MAISRLPCCFSTVKWTWCWHRARRKIWSVLFEKDFVGSSSSPYTSSHLGESRKPNLNAIDISTPSPKGSREQLAPLLGIVHRRSILQVPQNLAHLTHTLYAVSPQLSLVDRIGPIHFIVTLLEFDSGFSSTLSSTSHLSNFASSTPGTFTVHPDRHSYTKRYRYKQWRREVTAHLKRLRSYKTIRTMSPISVYENHGRSDVASAASKLVYCFRSLS